MNGHDQTRRYWRSLEQLEDDPQARAFIEREFPEGASELPEGVSRRSMLQLMGASLSLAGLAACRRPVEHIVPYVTAPEQMIPGIPRYFATTMPLGLHAYGVVVESHEGRPTKIEGNKLHAASGGASSVFMQAQMLNLYDPDRSTGVRHNGEAKSWADFVAAWAGLDADHTADGGARLAVLSESFASPTLARLAGVFGARFPRARWATYEPVSEENILEGMRRATGRALLPVNHVEQAKVILSLDADFLNMDGEAVRHTAAFSAGRRVKGDHGTMNRLYVVEGVHSVTGANADHRLRLAGGKVAGFANALAAKLGLGGSSSADGVDGAWIDAVAADLQAHQGTGLVIAGPRQSAEVHALVYAINAALGNVGTTVDCYEPRDAALPDRGALAALVAAMNGGLVDTLVVFGGNPVYNAPADLDFAAAMGNVANVIHFGDQVDETASAAAWHVPRAHFLESWGDARALGGAASVVQPLVEPLYGAKSDTEMLGLLAEGADGTGLDRVRATWTAVLGEAGFDDAWNRVLHDGVRAGSAAAPEAPAASSVSAASVVSSDLELVFATSASVYDGRWANNGWLQELPDTMTKLTWENGALVSPALAADRGLANGDHVKLTVDGRELEAPVWIVPGQDDQTVVLALGYGRTAGGRVANGVGVNAYALRSSSSPDVAAGLRIEAIGGTTLMATTQQHGSMTEPDMPMREGATRPLVREASLDAFHSKPDFAQHMEEVPHQRQMWPDVVYDEGNQWGMTIDLNACTGCNACTIACQSENNIPVVGKEQVSRGREMHWIRLDRYFQGDPAEPTTAFQAVPCMHCENAPCEQVCPVAATVHDDEGLNAMVYNRCIGTRYCSNNCPYKVRRFNFFNFTKDTPEVMRLGNNPDVTVRSRGVMEKCTYCTQRIQQAKISARIENRELVEGEVTTACQQACPAGAIEFGNILDENSKVARLKADPRNYGLLDSILTKPRTTYLARLRNPNPALAGPGDAVDHATEEQHG